MTMRGVPALPTRIRRKLMILRETPLLVRDAPAAFAGDLALFFGIHRSETPV